MSFLQFLWEEEIAEQGAFFGRIPLLYLHRVWPTSASVACQRRARAPRRAAITVRQSGGLLVNGSCVVIQNASGGDLKKRCQHFQIKTLSKAQWLKFSI